MGDFGFPDQNLPLPTTSFRAAAAHEPIFRRSTMRLAFPRINSVQSDNGAASIRFLRVNMNRDAGGLDYLFRFKTSSGEIDVRTTVAITTSSAATYKLAESGTTLGSLGVEEALKYVQEYAGEYGNTFEVRIFEVPSHASDGTVVTLRDAFCNLFLEYWSSYKYSNADEASDPAGFYPDTIHFVPYDLDKKFRVTLLAGQGGHHD